VSTTFNSSKIVLREIGTDANRSTGDSSYKNAFVIQKASNISALTAVSDLGLNKLVYENAGSNSNIESMNKLNWVDETNPAVKVSYDGVNQRLQFTVDRTVLGTGTGSNFNSFTVYGAADAQDTNNLGIPDSGNSKQVLIRGGEVLSAESFVADGEEIQLNDKRHGISVAYKSDTKSFVVSSGTTGENIAENGAIGVSNVQKASNIQIGRRALNSLGLPDKGEIINLNNRVIGGGENSVMGFGVTKADYLFSAGRGLAAQSAIATGRAAQGDLTNVFRLTGNGGENIFNISVNGISGVIEIPAGNYVGTTLATALEERINQISDPVTGEGVGGVTVRYSAATNSFTFITGTTGDASTIKVKGTSRLGLDDVPLGVGAIPKIYNLVQAKNADGVALYVDPDGNVVTTPPENMVSGFYPLYIDEGELTFDKTGKLVSPKNMVSFEQQGDGFSISLAVDFSASTQYAQPFSVLSVEQDGFTSGRLDGLEIDSSGTIRANYTNGQNNPLGKIVIASFNNQNGLKQVGNATYVETAVSGSPQVGEAGSEGFGSIQSGSLERSNVDITEELVNLITAQRNFQAAAKAIETTTTLTQTIINIRM
jgi:flagellar hook protein FlgE